jgi:hypothetical protein
MMAATIGGATHVAQTVATKAILDRMDTVWKITPEARGKMVKRLAELAKNRSTSHKPDLDRVSYAESPILARMLSSSFAGGDARVAYVSTGLGKTSACRAFLRTGRPPPGIAFCVNNENTPSYASLMLKYLNLDVSDPPEGWMVCLLEALEEVGIKWGRSLRSTTVLQIARTPGVDRRSPCYLIGNRFVSLIYTKIYDLDTKTPNIIPIDVVQGKGKVGLCIKECNRHR